AFVAGYETAARAGRACYPLADGYHPHGVWGAVGGAVAVATYRGYDADGVRRAARIAAKDAQHTLMAAATEGATVRQAFAGRANLDALLAADLASAGFSGVSDGVARHLSLAASEFDRAALAAGLGETWEVTRGYFKRHAACRYTHPTLDAVNALAQSGLSADAVASVRVETYPAAADLAERRPVNALQAKFSVPFAVATRLVHGTSGKEAFVEDAIDEATLALAARVTVVATDEMRAGLPDRRSARVVVETHDGRTLSETVQHAAGGAENPYGEDEVREKFDSLTEPVLGAERADALWTATRDGSGRIADVLELTRQ
ncbi:MmgE/PrpD family protein, partial [Salarchaeum sp. III]|uniref:MmgE/PrpD family protein n=1 Tax=Salarchaeum sp. III TaxID=3107927 RepID=UPI002EDA6726